MLAKNCGQWDLTPEKARKLRQIAERYTKNELEALLKLSAKNSRPIGISYLFKTVSIPNDDGQRSGPALKCSRRYTTTWPEALMNCHWSFGPSTLGARACKDFCVAPAGRC